MLCTFKTSENYDKKDKADNSRFRVVGKLKRKGYDCNNSIDLC